MSERVKLADAATLDSVSASDSLLAEHNGAIGRLPLSDGTGVGLSVSGGIVSAALGGSGTVDLAMAHTTIYRSGGGRGYVNAVRITVTGTYADTPLLWFVSQRRSSTGLMQFCLTGGSGGTNHTVRDFSYSSLPYAPLMVRTTGDDYMQFDIYIQKYESYDSIALTLLNLDTYFTSRASISYPGTLFSDEPEDATAATESDFWVPSANAVQSLSANGGGHFGIGPFAGQDRKRPDGNHPGRVETIAQGITARWPRHCA